MANLFIMRLSVLRWRSSQWRGSCTS